MKIREYQPTDSAAVQSVWQRAFASPPWYERLDQEEMARRWQACCKKRGFGCLLMEHDGQVVGFISWDTPTSEELAYEHGPTLAAFASKFERPIVWLRIICTDPAFLRQGVARRLRECAVSKFRDGTYISLWLTRHREDNTAIINLSRSMGFMPTGIRIPSSQLMGLYHEYWYRCA